jgi:hypothetical protein
MLDIGRLRHVCVTLLSVQLTSLCQQETHRKHPWVATEQSILGTITPYLLQSCALNNRHWLVELGRMADSNTQDETKTAGAGKWSGSIRDCGEGSLCLFYWLYNSSRGNRTFSSSPLVNVMLLPSGVWMVVSLHVVDTCRRPICLVSLICRNLKITALWPLTSLRVTLSIGWLYNEIYPLSFAKILSPLPLFLYPSI